MHYMNGNWTEKDIRNPMNKESIKRESKTINKTSIFENSNYMETPRVT